MAGKHALLAPSAASRWMACPVSVGLEQTIPDKGSSIHADEGSFAHENLADALENEKRAEEYLGRKGTLNGVEFEIDMEMAGSVQEFIDYVRYFGKNRVIERSIPLTPIKGEANDVCTPDTVIFNKGEMVIADFKYGKGVFVDARENNQLILYALAALREYSFIQDTKQVRMIIIQPRLGNIDEYSLSVEELYAKWGDKKLKPGRHYRLPGT